VRSTARVLDSESEASLLAKAKAIVDRDPGTALALLAEYPRRFPDGMLEQEAEVIAIEALVNLGEQKSAKSRLLRFRERFTDSAYLPHLDSIVRRGD
jgi:hypothetical protein